MRELRDILAAISRAQSGPLVLATVVGVEGSTYRRPGARMLVIPESRIGAISGGCLEDEVCRKAWWLTERGPAVLTYDTGLDDAESGYGLGCRGRVTVLLERVDPSVLPEYLVSIRDHQARGCATVIATVIAAEAVERVHVGDRLGQHDERCAPAIAAAMQEGRSRHIQWQGSAGEVRAFVEFIPPPIHLIVFGSGHDAEPLVRLSRDLGWRSTVMARRLSAHVAARFSMADTATQISSDSIQSVLKTELSSRAVAIVMSHNYQHDLDAMGHLLKSGISYIGVLGPRHRTDAMLRELNASADGRVFAPVGLDIGAESPEVVALAILAEVQAVFARRDGGPLRMRNRGIHDDACSALPGGSSAACGLDS